ncbi:MAG: OprO/OprP family phosphate-selective porin, partial [Prevotellaceae bacterium]|nr:OprO/OprP family phosphate-selective porin [Prevotellaceae bacterium]
DNTGRFDIRNARLKIAGKLNPLVDYGMQADYSTHGKFSFLDGYVRLKPLNGLTLWVGQFIVRFSENYVISQYQNMYSNRSFVAKFVNPDSRDLGMQLDYRIANIPLTAHAGVYNGSGINNPQWQQSPFVLSRLVYGTMEGFRAGVKYYGGKTAAGERIANYGFDLRYAGDRYTLETEYVIKDSLNTDVYLSAAYLQGAYFFPVHTKTVRYLTPTVRADAMGYDLFDRGFDVSRLTLGLNIGLDAKRMSAEIRFNYEYFIKKNESGLRDSSYYSAYFERADKGMFDKFTVEFLIKF